MTTIENGLAYDETSNPTLLHVINLEPRADYKLVATFSDGVTKSYDFKPLLDREVFRPLRDPDSFKKVTLDHGVPTWEAENVDLSPETIYAGGKVLA